MFVRVRSAHHWRAHDGRGRWGKTDEIPPREEWLIAEWPKGKPEPTDYWISNLPVSTKPGRLARLARLRWKIELDYRQLKGQLGLDHYEGRSWLGWYHHTALFPAAPGFLPLEGCAQITSGRPDPPPGSPTAPATVQVLDRPLLHLPTTRRPRPTRPPPSPQTRVTQPNKVLTRGAGRKRGRMTGPKDKSFAIPKLLVGEAWRQVKANKGAPGVDGQDLDAFEKDLENNLYKVWNRM